MRESIDGLLRESALRTLTFGIAIGWSLYQVAHGVAVFVDGLTTHLSSDEGPFSQLSPGGGLTWEVGHRIVTLDALLIGLVEFGLVVGAAAYLSMRRGAAADQGDSADSLPLP